jgi:hypothetical protein
MIYITVESTVDLAIVGLGGNGQTYFMEFLAETGLPSSQVLGSWGAGPGTIYFFLQLFFSILSLSPTAKRPENFKTIEVEPKYL